MSTTIQIKRSSTASAIPVTGDIAVGELAVNLADKRLYTKQSDGTIIELSTNPTDLDAATLRIDGVEITASSAELNSLDGFTGSTTELNLLDGLTATTIELNTLDGITASTAELNKLDGYTGSTAELNILDGVTATTAEINKLDGFTGAVADLNYAKDLRATGVTTAEFDKLDGLTATTAELNYTDGVTSNIQTQLNGKATSAQGALADSAVQPDDDVTLGAVITDGLSIGTSTLAGADLHIGSAQGTEQSILFSGFGTDKDGGIKHSNGAITIATGGDNTGIDSLTDRVTIDSTGVDVTGTITADGLTVEGSDTRDRHEVNIASGQPEHLMYVNDFYIGSLSTSDADNINGMTLESDFGAGVLIKSSASSTSSAKGNATKSLFIKANNDVSFYEDTGTTAKMTWDASAERLEIGDAVANDSKLVIRGGDYDPTTNGGMNSKGISIRGGTAGLGNRTGAVTFSTNAGGANAGSAAISGVLEHASSDDVMGLAFFTHSSTTSTSPAAERMRINASGNVGIGTDSPSTALDVTGTVTADGLVVDGSVEVNRNYSFGQNNFHLKLGENTADSYIGNANGSVYTATGAYYGASQYQLTGGATALSGVYSDALGVSIFSESGLTADSLNTRKQRVLIEDNGDVSFYEDTGTTAKMVWSSSAESLGIGSNASTIAGVNTRKDADSDVIGVYISNESTGASASSTYWNDAQGNNFYITTYGDGHARSNETWLGSTAGSSEIVFSPNNTERMRIDSAGNVGIGTASPKSKLDISSDGESIITLSGTGSNTPGAVLGGINFYNADGSVFGANNAAKITAVASTSTGADAEIVFSTKRGVSEGDDALESMRIAASGNVGIGTSNPAEDLHIAGTYPVIRLEDSDSTGNAYSEIQSSGGNLYLMADQGQDTGSSVLSMWTDGSERARIDSSGNLLVGTTDTTLYSNSGSGEGCMISAGGRIDIADTGTALNLNKLSTDGEIISFRKDGSTVGSIGTVSGDLEIHSSGANHVGLRFANGYISPVDNSGTLSDGIANLGTAAYKYKDLYLSGGVYLGGTGGANKLDDYETGAWTPTLFGATGGTATLTVSSASYTKIGNTVRVNCYITAVNATGLSGTVRLGGLPFSASQYSVGAVTYCNLFNFDERDIGVAMFSESGQSYANIMKGASNYGIAGSEADATNGSMMMTMVYKTNL